MAETQKQRIDRLALELQILSDTVEALALLESLTGKVNISLSNPADPTGTVLGKLTLSPTTLKALAQAEVDWRIAAMNQDNVQL